MKHIKTVILAVLFGILGFVFAAAMGTAFFGSLEIIIYAVLLVFAAMFIENERRKLAAKGLKSSVLLSAIYIPSVIAGLITYFLCRSHVEEQFSMAVIALAGLLCAISAVFTFIAEMVIIAVNKKLYAGVKNKK